MNVEGVGQADKEVEECSVVNRFGDLRVSPPDVSKGLDLFVADPVGVTREGLDEFEEQTVPG